MCLSIEVGHPERVLAKGQHEGFEWVVVCNRMGYRCGYVRIPLGHPWHGQGYEDIKPHPEVHGGLTFAEPDEPCGTDQPDNAWWLGFDCAHGGDAPDPDLPNGNSMRKFCEKSELDYWEYGTVRTQEYVEAECRSLCEQAKEAL